MIQILPSYFWWNDTLLWMHFITLFLSHVCYSCLYCRKFGVKCSRCGDRLLPRAEVMRVQSHVFHLQCFVCVVCCQPLVKGAEFVLRGGQLFCKQEFEKELYMMQQASPSGTIMPKYLVYLMSSLNSYVVMHSMYSRWTFFPWNCSLSWPKS